MLCNEKGFDEHMDIMENDVKERFKVGIRKEKNRKRKAVKKHCTVFAASVLLLCGITTIGCYVSPKFAFALKDIPLLNVFYTLSQEGEVIKEAKEHGYGNDLESFSENDEFKFSVDYGMKDSKNLILICSIEDKKENTKMNHICIKNGKLIKENGDKIVLQDVVFIRNTVTQDNIIKGILKISHSDIAGYEAVSGFKFDKVNEEHGGYGGVSFDQIEGNLTLEGKLSKWEDFDEDKKEAIYSNLMGTVNLNIELDKMQRSNSFKQQIDRDIDFLGENIKLTYVDVQPSQLEIELKGPDEFNPEKLVTEKLIRFKVEDEYGNEYESITNHEQENRAQMHLSYGTSDGITENTSTGWSIKKRFKSPYYNNVKTLILKDIEIDSWVEELISIDLKENHVESTTENAVVEEWKLNEDRLEITLNLKNKCNFEKFRMDRIYYKNKNFYEIERIPMDNEIVEETEEGVRKKVILDLSKTMHWKRGIDKIKLELKQYSTEKSGKYEGEIRIDLE